MAPPQFSEVIAGGDMRESLKAIRDRLATELEIADSSKDVAPLAKQLVDVIKAIESLPVPGEVSALDDLARARAARRKAADKNSAALPNVGGA